MSNKCRICGGPVEDSDDAVELLLDAGFEKEALEIFGKPQHLTRHREFNCPGTPEAIALLANLESTVAIGDCE